MKTSRYEDFKIAEGNRTINLAHLKRITESIEKHGYRGAPIVVSGDMTIIDGQHRYAACKELGIPVPYVIDKGATIETARTLNASQRAWRATDFVASYAATGNENYVRLHKFMESTGLAFRLAIKALRPDLTGAEQAAKEGTLVISSTHFKQGIELNNFWRRFDCLSRDSDQIRNIRIALAFLINCPEVDKTRLEKTLLKNGVKPFHGLDGAIREINEAYNIGAAKSKKIDFTPLYAAYLDKRRHNREATK